MYINRSCDVQILVNDRYVTTYNHKGDTFIEGRPGSSYKIRIKNNDRRRVKVVVSVDGLSVMDGQPASHNSKGYIINAYSSITIDGWRVSDDAVNQFVFGNKKSSYSAKLGEGTQNVGVIGVAVFPEDRINEYYIKAVYPTWIEPTFTYSSTRSVGSNIVHNAHTTALDSHYEPITSVASDMYNMSASAINNLGTQFGEQVESSVQTVTFNCSDVPTQIVTVYYDDRRGLEARGIVVDKRYERPDPFPRSNTYCKPV